MTFDRRCGRIIVSLAVAIVIGCRAPQREAKVASSFPSQPNIILITIDTLRFDATPLAPGGTDRMPFLADLAHRGVNFTKAYSTWDETVGSHFSIFTGYITGLGTLLDTPKASIAHQLKRRGYNSVGVAANLQLSPRACRVLSSFDNYLCIGDDWTQMTVNQQQAFYPEIDARIAAYGGRRTDFNRLMMYSTASRTLARFESAIDQTNAPFFAFLNIVEPHDPYFPDPARYDPTTAEAGLDHRGFYGDLRNRKLGPELRNPAGVRDRKLRVAIQRMLELLNGRGWTTTFDLHGDQVSIYRTRYSASVRDADRMLESLFAYLRSRHLLETTIVIITSDHGESFGEANLITHAFNDNGDRESTRHVPLLIVFPPAYRVGGRTIGSLCSLADLAPTIYDLAGIDWTPLARQTDAGNYGKPLLPSILGPASKRPPSMLGESASPDTPEDRRRAEQEREKRLRSLGYIH